MITLVTTYYNEPEYLQKYIEAFNQHNKSLVKRLIVVDDGSTDNSISIIDSFVKNIFFNC